MVSVKREYHFFHGFLGEPADWDPTIDFMSQTLSSAKIYKHDLLKDCQPLESLTFEAWARKVESSWGSPISGQLPTTPQRILVGYSLGGRLCLHINPEHYSHLFLIAAHPGLKAGFKEREEQDQAWAQSLLTEEPTDWLERWNSQLVFSQDLVRPKRSLQGQQDQWSEILKSFSLSRQSNKDKKIQSNKNKIYWIVGEKDLKFQTFMESMKMLLGEDHVVEIPQAGHAVLFDQPEFLARVISERCPDVG